MHVDEAVREWFFALVADDLYACLAHDVRESIGFLAHLVPELRIQVLEVLARSLAHPVHEIVRVSFKQGLKFGRIRIRRAGGMETAQNSAAVFGESMLVIGPLALELRGHVGVERIPLRFLRFDPGGLFGRGRWWGEGF